MFWRDACVRDVRKLAPHLREIDKLEITLGTNETPELALLRSLAESTITFTIVDGCVPVGMFGLKVCDGYGVPWAVGTPLMASAPITFLRESKRLWDDWSMVCPVLTNIVHPDNAVHIRWLNWLGVEWTDTVVRGGTKFRRFTRVRPNRWSGDRCPDDREHRGDLRRSSDAGERPEAVPVSASRVGPEVRA